MDKIREQCIARGARGIIGLKRTFKIMDDNRDRKLTKEELKNGLEEYGLSLEDEEIEEIFQTFDIDENGTVIFDEFLRGVRPPMPDCRVELIEAAFEKLDKTGEGIVTVEDLHGVYDASQHPKFLSGEMTEDEVFEKFLRNFDKTNDPDGTITKDDFLCYYAGVSSNLDDDEHFVLMMKNAWRL